MTAPQHTPASPSDRKLCIAAIAGAHGVRGLVKLKTFTEFPEDVAAYGPLTNKEGQAYDITFKGMVKGLVLAQLSGVTDRNQAQELRGTELFIDRDLLPAPEEEDEFYYSDLVGLRVEDKEGTLLGLVRGVYNFGAGDILEFGLEGKKPEMVTFTESYVPEVDLEAGRLVVVMPQVVLAQAPVPPVGDEVTPLDGEGA